MNITEITKKVGAKPKRKRVGRGESSGWGKTSGRGHKGAGQRAGYKASTLGEGANFPLFRRIPKYGFSNKVFRTEYQIVNVSDLAKTFDAGAHVTPAEMQEKGLIRDKDGIVKVLGNGELIGKLTVEAHRFSGSAESKIAAAGGSAKWLAPRPKKKFVRKPKWQVEAEKPPTSAKEAKVKGKSKEKAEGKAKSGPKAKAKAEAAPQGKQEPAPATEPDDGKKPETESKPEE